MKINEECSLSKTVGLREGGMLHNVHIHEINSPMEVNNSHSEEGGGSQSTKGISMRDILHNPINTGTNGKICTFEDKTPEFASVETPLLSSGTPKNNTGKSSIEPITMMMKTTQIERLIILVKMSPMRKMKMTWMFLYLRTL